MIEKLYIVYTKTFDDEKMKKNAGLIRKIGIFRINKLFSLAEKNIIENTTESKILSKRYVKLALNISSHYKIKLDKKYTNKICKNCNNFLIPGINTSVRLGSNGFLIYLCKCGYENKIFIKTK